MTMKSIGLDFDGVLYRWHESLYQYFVLYRDYDGSYETFWKDYKSIVSEDDLEYYASIDTLYSNMMPTCDCLSFLDQIKDRFNIFYITSRPVLVKTTTEAYMRRYSFPQRDNLVFTYDKGSYARRLRLSYFVEDSQKNAEELRAITTVILMAQPWNKPVWYEYPTVRNLNEILQYLED